MSSYIFKIVHYKFDRTKLADTDKLISLQFPIGVDGLK